MPFHVPFEHRNLSSRKLGPIYIGFDQPVSIQKRRKRFNWCAFTGLLMALVSPLTLFIIAPISLLFSLLGLRRGPRGMAIVALVLSLVSTTILSAGIFAISKKAHHSHRIEQSLIVQRENQPLIEMTMATLKTSQSELRDFRSENKNQLPSLEEGMMMTVRHDDGWGTPLRYGTTDNACLISSAGMDGEFNTSDDLTVKLDGQPKASSPIANLEDIVE